MRAMEADIHGVTVRGAVALFLSGVQNETDVFCQVLNQTEQQDLNR